MEKTRPQILSISELTRDLKEVLENIFVDVWVEGEVSNLRAPASGHLYFSLKDASCSLRCVLFRNAGVRATPGLADGMRVVAAGRIGIYGRDGQYQLYVNKIEPKGEGALRQAFEELKSRLQKEGLFDEARKRPLPFLPRTIGVVTSPTGAVIRDILQVLERRLGGIHVIVNPVRVQGDGAAQEIAQALKELNEGALADVIILARGGGSLEDLWCFNEEVVARAIVASEIPVISAVGHETDFTIADFAADKRAPTPSAAAEIAVPASEELKDRIGHLVRHLWRSLVDAVPQQIQHIDDLLGQMERALDQKLEEGRITLEGRAHELEALNPLAILRRGYSVTTTADGKTVVRRAGALARGDLMRTRLAQGVLISRVEEIK